MERPLTNVTETPGWRVKPSSNRLIAGESVASVG